MVTVVPSGHLPVLREAVMRLLSPAAGDTIVDATLGGGGHAEALLRAALPGGRLLGLDADPAAVARGRERLAFAGDAAVVRHANFRDLARAAREAGVERADVVLLDLGLSSFQLDDDARGFSFRSDAPPDFRLDPTSGEPFGALLRGMAEETLETHLRAYGEEPRARSVARAILRARDAGALTSVRALAEVAGRSALRHRHRHPATRTLQALRILVNDEIGSLRAALPAAFDLLAPGGRLGVIAFHSLEDREVKRNFRARSDAGEADLLTKKPVRAERDEVRTNPRSRSAHLRVLRKALARA